MPVVDVRAKGDSGRPRAQAGQFRIGRRRPRLGIWLSDAWIDLRFALRTFRQRRGFTAVAALTLALGMGATTAVFSIVNAVLLRPLPYKNPDRLAAVWLTSTREQGLAKIFATHADYVEFHRHARSFESIGAATWATRTSRVLTGWGPTREVLTIPATASFFDTLGVQAALGRTFTTADEGRGCSIVLAHKFWLSTLGGNPSVIGRSLALDQTPCTVLGVMPERFGFYPTVAQAWILLGPGFQADQDRMLVGIFARLKPGVTLEQAQTELRGFYRGLHPEPGTRDFEPVVYDLHGEFTFLAGRTLRTTVLLAFGAVLLVLLIACLNVANLLSSRLAERRRELAVRAALGSGQNRLVRQMLAEALLLSGLGSALGVAIAFAGVHYFRLASPIELNVGADVQMSWPVLAFSGALTIATTMIFGLLPALRASRVDLLQHLKTSGRGFIASGRGWAKTAIGVEMALSFLLLMGACLLISSAFRMGSAPLGFHPDGVMATRLSLPSSRYPTDALRLGVYDRLLERLEAMPGVAGVALGSQLPPDAGGNRIVEVQGRAAAAGSELHEVGADTVSPRYFDALHIPLRRGRLFDARDLQNSPPVAIVNDALARKYFPETDPLGQQIRIADGPMPWLTIVGVVGSVKTTRLMNEMSWEESPLLYRPLAQDPRSAMQLAVRATGGGVLGSRIQDHIAALDSSIPLTPVESLTNRLTKVLAYPRFRAMVLTFFALGALILSAVGLHGVLAQSVTQRMPEFGVRKAVGAQTRDLLSLVAAQGGLPVLAGIAAGIVATPAFARVLAHLLYGVEPADPAALGLAASTLLGVAALAILLPAVRAARVDPMVALRDE